MRYSKGVIITLLAKGLALPIGIASSIITARTLGPEGRGVLALMIFFQGLTLQFGTMGLNASITYFMSREPQRASGITRNAVTLAVVGGLIIAGTLWGLAVLFPSLVLGDVDIGYLEIFLISIPFTFLAQFLQNVFLAKQKIYDLNLLDLGVRFLQMAAFGIFLWWLGGGTQDAIWVFTGALMIGGIAYVVRIRQVQPFRSGFESDIFRRMFTYGAKVYIASILMFLVLRVHLMIINVMLGEAAAGVYSVALQFIDIVYLVPVALGMILFPKISSGSDPNAFLTKRVMRTTFAGMIIISATLASVSKPIIHIMFGEEFSEAATVLVLLSPGILTLSVSTIVNNDLAGRGLPIIVILTPLIVLLLSLPALYYALPDYGIEGAATISSMGNVLMMLFLTTYFKRRFSTSWSDLFILKYSDLSMTPPKN